MAFPLTDEQKKIVDDRGGELLVSAAAGSGKTRVLVERLLDRVTRDGLDLDRFLVITYTKAAAAELRTRIAQELSSRLAENPGDRHLRRQSTLVYRAQISTIHAFCSALLREEGHRLDLDPDFRLCDEGEAQVLMAQVLEDVLEEQYEGIQPDSPFAVLVDTLSAGRDDSRLAQIVLDVFGRIQSHPHPERWLREQREAWELSGVTDAGETAWGRLLLTDAARQGRDCAKRLEEARKAREERQDRLRAEIYARLPRVAAIDRELRRTITQIIAASLRDGSDPVPAIGVIRDKNLSLQAEKAALLTEHGYPADALDDKPACPKCSDTGWVGANMCACLKALCTEEQIRELSKLLDLGEQSFDSFSLDYYSPLPWPGESLSPRENMEFIFDVCSSYARKFGRFYFRNLFLTGAPGLGKTFLSACIARTVSESGFSVVYDTAVNIFTRFEEQKFARDKLEAGEAKDETRRYLGCDLLILDDLGSELSTPFVQSALYTLINTRLTADKRTVISSNLTMDQVRARYTPQIASRLEGEYRVLPFYGEDIRLLRKQTL